MKLKLKTLSGTLFTIVADEDEKIGEIMARVAEMQNLIPATVKFMFYGRYLARDESPSSAELTSQHEIVVLGTKSRGRPVRPVDDILTKPLSSTRPVGEVPGPRPVTPSEVSSDRERGERIFPGPGRRSGVDIVVEDPGDDPSFLPVVHPPPSDPDPDEIPVVDVVEEPDGPAGAGDDNPMVAQFLEMGFLRGDIVRALEAAYNDPARASEYLISGNIPDVSGRPPADDAVLSQTEEADVQRIMFMGFPRDAAKRAYLARGKDAQSAVNWLLESGGGF